MRFTAYVDESKVGGLTLFVTLVATTTVKGVRRKVRTMCRGGSRRFHARKEGRKQIALGIEIVDELGLQVRVYDFRHLGGGVEARRAALTAMVHDLASLGVSQIVIERDDSLVGQDRQVLYEQVRKAAGAGPLIEYQHTGGCDEPLLWPSDLVGWCWFRPDWKAKVMHLAQRWGDEAA